MTPHMAPYSSVGYMWVGVGRGVGKGVLRPDGSYAVSGSSLKTATASRLLSY